MHHAARVAKRARNIEYHLGLMAAGAQPQQRSSSSSALGWTVPSYYVEVRPLSPAIGLIWSRRAALLLLLRCRCDCHHDPLLACALIPAFERFRASRSRFDSRMLACSRFVQQERHASTLLWVQSPNSRSSCHSGLAVLVVDLFACVCARWHDTVVHGARPLHRIMCYVTIC